MYRNHRQYPFFPDPAPMRSAVPPNPAQKNKKQTGAPACAGTPDLRQLCSVLGIRSNPMLELLLNLQSGKQPDLLSLLKRMLPR